MKLVEGAHTIVSFAAGKIDSLSQGLARVSQGAKIISLDTKHSSGGHVTESLLAQLQDTPMLAEAMGQMLKSVASRGAGMMLKPSGRIVIHPGAGNEAKRWPAERFIELAERLAGEGRAVRIVLGEVELEKWPKELIDRAMVAGKGGEVRGGEVRVVTPDRLLDLLDEIAAADVFIGNDSGPGHLAGILGVPTVSLYGGEGEHRWRPLGPRVRVLQVENLQTLTMQQVYDTLRETGSPP